MFASCRNNPVSRMAAAGTDDICVTANEDNNPFNDVGGECGGLGGGAGSGYGTTTLYRSVGSNEALDIANTGKFRTTNTSIFRSGTLTVYEDLLELFNELVKGTIAFLR